jgi:hypothetical protein
MTAFQVHRIHDRPQWLGTFPTWDVACDAAIIASKRGAEPVEARACDEEKNEINLIARYVAGVRVFYEGTVRA